MYICYICTCMFVFVCKLCMLHWHVCMPVLHVLYVCMLLLVCMFVQVCMYVCMYVYMYVQCMYVYMYVFMYVCTGMYVCMCLCAYVCLYWHACMYVCLYWYIFMYVCTGMNVETRFKTFLDLREKDGGPELLSMFQYDSRHWSQLRPMTFDRQWH